MSETAEQNHDLEAYAQPRLGRSLLDLATSVVPYLALTALMYLTLGESIWLTLGLAIPTGGFLLRTFIVFHDCGHGSFMPSKRANRWVGRFTALLVWQPYENWRFDHAVHHGTAGDLDRRGQGDVPTLTVEEYYSRPWQQRLGYRLFRNPLVMFGIGPLWSLMIGPRLSSRDKRRRLRNSIILTNIALARRGHRRSACWSGSRRSCSSRSCPPTSPGWRASGCSTSSTSSRTSTGRRRERWSYDRRRARGQLVPEAAEGAAVLHRQHRPPPRPPPQRARAQLQPAGRPRRERGLRRGPGADHARQPPLPAAEADRRRQRPPAHLGRGPGARPRADRRRPRPSAPRSRRSSPGSAASRRRTRPR